MAGGRGDLAAFLRLQILNAHTYGWSLQERDNTSPHDVVLIGSIVNDIQVG